jgi:hypothetical protein
MTLQQLRALVSSAKAIEYGVSAIASDNNSLSASVHVMGLSSLLGYILIIIGTWLFISVCVWAASRALMYLVSL